MGEFRKFIDNRDIISFKLPLSESEVIYDDIMISVTPETVKTVNGSLKNYRDYSNTVCQGSGIWIRALKLTDLQGCPRECNYFNGSDNALTTLEGGPLKVFGECDLRSNQLTSLTGIGRKYFKLIDKTINISNNPLTSAIMGLALIEKLQVINVFKDYATSTSQLLTTKNLIEIYLASNENKEILDLKEILIGYGLKDYAKL